ncbi:MAG TPA: hypothetical protein VEV84_04385 [Pyrinomonadaceae bacterium]|nr:hypothetical protein [Pyrinomonadaceae bacterium]
MKKIFAVCVYALLVSITANAQRIDKPTLTPKPCSDEQKATAARFISLEYNTERSKHAATLIYSVVGSTEAKKGADNKIVIGLDFGAPTDEGNFGPAELIMSMVDALAKTDDPKTKNMTAEEKFIQRISSVISFLDTKDNKLKSTFSAKAYFPFMLEMKRLGFVKPFGYIVLVHNGNEEALKWIRENDQQVKDFLVWAKSYSVSAS